MDHTIFEYRKHGWYIDLVWNWRYVGLGVTLTDKTLFDVVVGPLNLSIWYVGRK